MGIRRINEYMFFDEEKQELQLDVPSLLAKMGFPDTPETRQQATDECCRVFREYYPDVTQDVHTLDYGTKRVYNPTTKTGMNHG